MIKNRTRKSINNYLQSSPETEEVVVRVVVVVVVIGGGRLVAVLINQALNAPKLLHVAREDEWARVIESVLLLSFLEKLHEQRVVHV